jgi:hypothetical protein
VPKLVKLCSKSAEILIVARAYLAATATVVTEEDGTKRENQESLLEQFL